MLRLRSADGGGPRNSAQFHSAGRRRTVHPPGSLCNVRPPQSPLTSSLLPHPASIPTLPLPRGAHDAAMARTAVSNRAATRWTVRIIPFFIVAAFVLGTYAVVGRLCGKSKELRVPLRLQPVADHRPFATTSTISLPAKGQVWARRRPSCSLLPLLHLVRRHVPAHLSHRPAQPGPGPVTARTRLRRREATRFDIPAREGPRGEPMGASRFEP